MIPRLLPAIVSCLLLACASRSASAPAPAPAPARPAPPPAAEPTLEEFLEHAFPLESSANKAAMPLPRFKEELDTLCDLEQLTLERFFHLELDRHLETLRAEVKSAEYLTCTAPPADEQARDAACGVVIQRLAKVQPAAREREKAREEMRTHDMFFFNGLKTADPKRKEFIARARDAQRKVAAGYLQVISEDIDSANAFRKAECGQYTDKGEHVACVVTQFEADLEYLRPKLATALERLRAAHQGVEAEISQFSDD